MSLSTDQSDNVMNAIEDSHIAPCVAEEVAEQFNVELRRYVAALLALGSHDIYRQMTRRVDRTTMQMIMDHCRGNKVHASNLLGISRATLRIKLKATEDPR